MAKYTYQQLKDDKWEKRKLLDALKAVKELLAERDPDVFREKKQNVNDLHPTMKPVLLFDYEMQCNTKPGDSVLDLFGGSGTLIIAAQQNKRTAYVMEYDPKYIDVIIDRWEKFTGEKAVKLN